ncbi:MAG: HAMP domain-containing histidine kinase [Chloroflexi bacterium]|nr:HAMP domain-containing histidine kinase [Chloroflexota bacterium]MCC6895076.1 HAMP domain-containing histidine kinase [Anaerolineae bacterium]
MNRLSTRLTLAFLSVTLVTVILVALLAGVSARDQFNRYVEERDEALGTLMPDDAIAVIPVATSAQTAPNVPNTSGQKPPFGNRPGGMGSGGDHQQPGMLPRTPEDSFRERLNLTLIIAALAAGGMGTLMGFYMSRNIAAPLAKLSSAARDFAARKWDRRVPEQGASEIADVARAFNAMADALQHAEMLRRNLMADIAHELRTPLTVMQGNLRALLDGVYPLEMREVATLYDETRLLSRLVADLRELALAEAGQLPLNLQTVELRTALNRSIEQFALAAEAQDTQIEITPSSLPSVQADPDRLVQVMHNLLANALRYTPGGRIRISGEQVANVVRIQVSDTGKGIAKEDLPHLFDRFYQGDDSRAGSNTGLGLAIAKAWVEAMGGTIGVESNTGEGSTFWFTLKPVRG